MTYTEIKIGRQAILLKSNDNRVKVNLDSVKSHLTLFETIQDPRSKKFIKVPKNLYYLYVENGNEFEFYVSINNLGEIVRLLRMSNVHNTAKIINLDYNLDKVNIPINNTYVLRDDQEAYVKKLIDESSGYSNLLDIAPGKGKSITGSFASMKLQRRIGILVKPSYLEKWYDDVKKYSLLEDDNIFVIKGRHSLVKLFSLKKDELRKIKIYIISMRTITNYFVMSTKEDEYSVTPDEFMNYTGISTILNDESHKEFEALYKCIMWMNPYKLFGLSATMDSDKPNQNYFYNLLYPKKDRLVSMVGYHRYYNVIFADYNLAKGIFLPHKTHRGYNHIMYEQAIMKNMHVLQDYIDMIIHYIDKDYIDYHINGEKCVIFFSTIDMCTIFAKKLEKLYPAKKIKRYTGDDDYTDMLTGDIIISTPGSLGTAIDINGLITVIQTVTISDKQLNIQSIGRLREIKDREVKYICLQSNDLKKQFQIKQKRLNIFKEIAKTIHYEKYSNPIGTKGVSNNGNKSKQINKFFNKPKPKYQFNTYFGKKKKFY